VDFTNPVLIMTSNLPGDPLTLFKPEFVNRIDEIVRFGSLTSDDLSHIVEIQLAGLRGRLAARRIFLEVSHEAEVALARQGFDVYMVDIRGYGQSSRPPEMDQPAEANHPIVDSEVAARDYAAAADWIRTRRQVPRINVMGHSWGTVITARYATQHSDKISRLVLLAPVWLRQDGASLTDSGGALGAYRTVTIEAARKRKDTGL
jgi:pimeloyl-ACP methyl ester carboxylesterase